MGASRFARLTHLVRSSGTIGGYVSAFGGVGVEGTASACLLVAVDSGTQHLKVGMTYTAGGGTGIPAAGVGLGPVYSNATSISEQQGPFGQVGGSGDLGISMGNDVTIGNDPNNRDIFTSLRR